MLGTEILHSPRPEFERFLQGSVGEDRNGHAVTVLSTFARLELDPWIEASELATMRRDAACRRLGLLLSKFADVPALAYDHASVAWDLTLLLPERPSSASMPLAGVSVAKRHLVWSGVTWAVGGVLLILVLMKLAGVSG